MEGIELKQSQALHRGILATGLHDIETGKGLSAFALAKPYVVVVSCLLVLLFLGNPRATAGILLALPLSLLCAFIGLLATGDTLNAMTLSGLALSIGVLVDDSIVVLENISTKLGRGMPPQKAALLGASEVAMPVLASTLSTIVVFFPVVFLKGITRRAPIDVQIEGPQLETAHDIAEQAAAKIRPLPGAVDVRVQQRNDAPAFMLDVDRKKADKIGLTTGDIVKNVVSAINGSATFNPAIWVDPKTGIDYFMGVQFPEKGIETAFSIQAAIGAIFMIGIAVANGVLLIEFIQHRLKVDDSLTAAILNGSATRLRPILMTSLSAVLGLAPMALGLGRGAEANVPLGRAVIGGQLVSTALTLFVVPVLFSLLRGKDSKEGRP